MEALILALVIAWAVKKAAESSHEHWQGAKAANRKASKGKPVRKRAASAVQHDVGYWLHQVLNGFPVLRNGLAAGWHAGREAQQQGAAERQRARTGHLERQVDYLQEIREHRRRQQQAMEKIRQPEPGPDPEPEPAEPEPQQPRPQPQPAPSPPGDSTPPATPDGRNTMPGDTTYTQQMHELTEIRRDAEEEVNSVRRKRMLNRLDILQSLGLDKDTLSEAAAIDDALQQQEKAAQQTLDATDAAMNGLSKRHGGIQEAVSSSPVDKPAEPEFYQD